MKFRFLKQLMRLAIGAWLLYLLYFHHTYTKSQDDNVHSTIASTLSDFTGAARPYYQYTTIDSTSSAVGKTIGKESINALVEDYNQPLNRDFSRIPGYIKGSKNSSLFGYVMRDLSNRFLLPSSDQQKRQRLSRQHSSPSNILVVCSGANLSLSEIKMENITTIASKQELIKKFGYKIGESFLVESVFHGHNTIGVDSNVRISDESASDITDILLAVFDPDQGQEDDVITIELEKYIRSGIIQFAIFRISTILRSTSHLDDLTRNDDNTEMYGVVTSKVFLDAGYKLQVLSSSHAPTDASNPYGPNTLLKDVDDTKRFLRFGGALARNLGGMHSSRNGFNRSTTSKTTETPIAFHSILFATRGLDLAIPTRKAFMNLSSYKLDHVLNVYKDGIPYVQCPRSTVATTLSFRRGFHPNYNKDDDNDQIDMFCFGRKITMNETDGRLIDHENSKIIAELWRSHQNISLSEAACLKCTKVTLNHDEQKRVERACTNRIVSMGRSPAKISGQTRSGEDGPDMLVIELKGVNQNMLKPSFTHLEGFLRSLGFKYFPNFLPTPGIQNSEEDRCRVSWYDMVLEGNGYQMYRGSNECVPLVHSEDKRNVVQHGSQMGGVFCFDYDRPNCLGEKHAANHLFDHVKKFIRLNRDNNMRWASYITLIDGTEETETLAGTLDRPLTDFLYKIKSDMSSEEWSNTVIIIFSDDVEEPILFLKANENEMSLLKKQKALYTSDLHRLLRSMITKEEVTKALCASLSLEEIDTNYQLGIGEGYDEHKYDSGQVTPPSILSFYADISKENKFQLISTTSEIPAKRAKVVKGCRCATNLLPWFPCDNHPWSDAIYRTRKETHILVDCPGEPLHLEVDLGLDQSLVERYTKKRKESTSTHMDKINIMFLEIDSVSQEYADRHFPRTRELLERYRIERKDKSKFECVHGICSAKFPYTQLVGANSIPNQVAALSGCISTSSEELCGHEEAIDGDICDDPDMMQYSLRLERQRQTAQMAYWCQDRDLKRTKTPWLFGVSDSKGYINFFAEEFCYDESPYVTQGNVFPKIYQDIQSHHVFCNLAERKITMENLTVHPKNRWGVDISDPCLEGNACPKDAEKSTISLQFMQQMWDAYSSYPKLAFLNAIAAHDYSSEWEMIIPRAELYDEHIHDFLEAMLSRADSRNTVIIIRSDHGLQKGPMAMDNSVQIEHRHPWTEILVPENLVASKSTLFKNQDRMLTGYDLYRTMRFLMSDRNNDRHVEGGIPDWAFDILSEEIPSNRTCEDAKVDMKLCRSLKQTRRYGICNKLDNSQARFC